MGMDSRGRPAPVPTGNKVSLNKAQPSVSLTKSSGAMRINLNWNARPAGGGGFFKRLVGGTSTGNIDLDLACLWELRDGSKGVLQAVGGRFAAYGQNPDKPVVWLDGDDRSGLSAGGENLYIDLTQREEIARILVFAFIYAGAPNWEQAQAVVTLVPESGPELEILLDEPDPEASTCAIAMVTNTSGEIVVKREVRYLHGMQRKADETYGWGLHWSPKAK